MTDSLSEKLDVMSIELENGSRRTSFALSENELDEGESSPFNVSPETVKILSADIADVYYDGKELKHIEDDKEDIRKLFEKYIKDKEFKRKMDTYGLDVIGIFAFGSSATPLASCSGDLDLCIWLRPKEGKKGWKFDPNHPLRVLLKNLRSTRFGVSSKNWKAPIQIPSAKVPIVKAIIYGYDVDVSVHIGEEQHPNTCAARTIQAYGLYNPKFVPLCFYVKEWFNHIVRQNSAEAIIPNSYTVTLMLAQFMQQKKLLPNLFAIYEDRFFYPSTDTTFPDLRGDCSITDADLERFQRDSQHLLKEEVGLTFYRFLHYLTTEVDLKNEVMLVESAEYVPYSSMEDVVRKHELLIYDVFDKFNPGRRIKFLDGFIDFLKTAKGMIENSGNPARLSDRLYCIKIDYKKIERHCRLHNITANVSNDQEQEEEMARKDVVETEKKKKNRPSTAERKKKANPVGPVDDGTSSPEGSDQQQQQKGQRGGFKGGLQRKKNGASSSTSPENE
ncbi:unnamed protein product [Caenorhabditis sp. 36 PRJEB53466]|nr:unnamed protein product [Caenorhabditis sp. 36 PRJEB53466]